VTLQRKSSLLAVGYLSINALSVPVPSGLTIVKNGVGEMVRTLSAILISFCNIGFFEVFIATVFAYIFPTFEISPRKKTNYLQRPINVFEFWRGFDDMAKAMRNQRERYPSGSSPKKSSKILSKLLIILEGYIK
jgi:hypothetical protein